MQENLQSEGQEQYGSWDKPIPKWRKKKFPYGLSKKDFPCTWCGKAEYYRWQAARHKLLAKMYMSMRMTMRLRFDERYRKIRNEHAINRGIRNEQKAIMALVQEIKDKGHDIDIGALGLTETGELK